MNSSVTTVEMTMPLIMVMPISVIISLVPPIPKAMGTMARTVVKVVIRMGRTRRGQAWRMASSRLSPMPRRILMYSIKMMELLTTVPASMMMDTNARMDISRPVRGRANRAPVKATGRIIMTMAGMTKDSNCTASTKYTSSRATTRAKPRSEKLSIVSSYPPLVSAI